MGLNITQIRRKRFQFYNLDHVTTDTFKVPINAATIFSLLNDTRIYLSSVIVLFFRNLFCFIVKILKKISIYDKYRFQLQFVILTKDIFRCL